MFVLWSEHITEWTNCESTQETYVHVAYPRRKFVRESRVKSIMTTEIVELSEEQRKINNLALRCFAPDSCVFVCVQVSSDSPEGSADADHCTCNAGYYATGGFATNDFSCEECPPFSYSSRASVGSNSQKDLFQ